MALRERRNLPAAIRDAPDVPLGLEIYFQAFWELTTCRGGGMGLIPISWMTIIEYAQLHELDDEQTDDLLYFVRAMDKAYMEHHAAKLEQK